MSEPEHTSEQKSSIKLERMQGGSPKVEVKVYDGVQEDELDRIRNLAVQNYRALEHEFYGGDA